MDKKILVIVLMISLCLVVTIVTLQAKPFLIGYKSSSDMIWDISDGYVKIDSVTHQFRVNNNFEAYWINKINGGYNPKYEIINLGE